MDIKGAKGSPQKSIGKVTEAWKFWGNHHLYHPGNTFLHLFLGCYRQEPSSLLSCQACPYGFVWNWGAPKFSWKIQKKWRRWGVKPLHGTGFPGVPLHFLTSPCGKTHRRPGFPGQPRCPWGATKLWNKTCELDWSGNGVNQLEKYMKLWHFSGGNAQHILRKSWIWSVIFCLFSDSKQLNGIMALSNSTTPLDYGRTLRCTWQPLWISSVQLRIATKAIDVFPPRTMLVKLFAFRISLGVSENGKELPWNDGTYIEIWWFTMGFRRIFWYIEAMDPWEHCCWATEQTSMRRTEVARCPFPYSFILRWRVNPLRTNRQMILDDLPDWQLDFLSKRTLGSEWIVISIYMLNILFISQFDSWKGCWAEN